MPRHRLAVVASDVNETLLDLAPVCPALVAEGRPEHLLDAVLVAALLALPTA